MKLSAPFRQAEGRPARFLAWLMPVLTASLALVITAAALGSGVGMRVSTNSGGTGGDWNSYDAAISADGRYVTFAPMPPTWSWVMPTTCAISSSQRWDVRRESRHLSWRTPVSTGAAWPIMWSSF